MLTQSPIASEGRRNSPTDVQEANAAEPICAPLEVTYYTDPLCSWSWAMEPQWRRLRYEFGDRAIWRYSMGGLIPDWQQFSDPLNNVSRPIQMGPIWVQVRHLTQMPIDDRLWVENPPNSSYPACIAVKAAQKQSENAGDRYLRRLREAAMLERRNIADRDVLLELAAEIGLQSDRFAADLNDSQVLQAFREDLKEMRYYGIGRFPTLVLRVPSGRSLLMVGYRPYNVLRDAIAEIAPDLEPQRSLQDAIAYATDWGSITAREVAEAIECDLATATNRLDAAVSAGQLQKCGQLYRSV